MSYFQRLKSFNSSELSDALDAMHIEGALSDIKQLALGHQLIGPAYTILYEPYKTKPKTFKSAGNYIDNVPKGSVLFIDNGGREDCTVWGNILTHTAQQRAISGTIIFGSCRDVAAIRALNYPVFTKGITMRSGKNRVYKACEQIELTIGQVTIKPGDIVFADDCGVVVIPIEHCDTVITYASNIKQTEQLIIDAVHQGMSLQQARETYHYDRPWLNL
jgi:regulator of RNase E activity RraA